MNKWMWNINRNPTEEECEEAGDVGFIVCVSGKNKNQVYDHAIMMGENYFYDGIWHIKQAHGDLRLTVHGWIVPPGWWQEPADMLHVGDELIWNDGSISVVLAVNGSTFHELTQFGYVTEQCYADPGTAPGWKRTGAHYKIEDVIKKMMEHSKIDEEDEYEE